MKKTDVYIWCLGAFLCSYTFQSCSREEIQSADQDAMQFSPKEIVFYKKYDSGFNNKPESTAIHEILFKDGFTSEPCEITDFGRILSGYSEALLKDPLFDPGLIFYYTELHRKYVTYYVGENYYGENGEYDQTAKKRIRELESFWNLNREIRLNGQHFKSLEDREILTDMIESFDRTVRNRDEAYEKADWLLEINKLSPNIPENPFFSLDAFTRSNGLLVIGDGLLQSLVDVGIEGKVAFSSILAHEWWHQVQFENDLEWNSASSLPPMAERSRFSELEADFAAAYFLSHKRGATYNWKRIADYFELSFNVGDCLTNSSQHHGTPTQRSMAARAGFDLADSAKKKGSVLEAGEVHNAFLKFYNSIILGTDLEYLSV
ncbi:hypothetical protein [Christiangramia sabulilitoris]|uniref:Uncharacterized protein n=1 Tax=Christiangramia sabulilitoris TaxID=2583991 RepID=A0A550I320_9FLAO|nr:hypothetical protein [Christiangramia sabulilitoris]TRO65355.1 hypothetical protein FGM01_08075 [Christiangramia sabulilitoris]